MNHKPKGFPFLSSFLFQASTPLGNEDSDHSTHEFELSCETQKKLNNHEIYLFSSTGGLHCE